MARTTLPPTKNDAVLGRGGQKNQFRKDSLFRKLIEDNWSKYCDIDNFKSAEKRQFVKMFIVDPILKQGGRFLKFEKKQLEELLPVNPQDSKELYKRIAQCLRDEKKKVSSNDMALKDRLAASPALIRSSSPRTDKSTKDLVPIATAPLPGLTPATKTKGSKKGRVVTVEKPAASVDRRVVFSDEVALENTCSVMPPQANHHNDEASFVSMSDSSSSANTNKTMSDSSFYSSDMMSDDASSIFSDFDSEPLPIDYHCFRSVSEVFSNLLTWSATSESEHVPLFDERDHEIMADNLPDLAPATLDASQYHHRMTKGAFTGYHPGIAFGEDNADAIMDPLCEFDGFPEFCAL